ncbi:MAG: short-chain dehydrogenase [[Candidatus Thermochlorobacteriaceae] bacterium GBChlB]|nr:MAG: short-chain dehydrogenase [[Candidatus Thermochlorobacteriaceae] bacterium GBChlB]
MNGKVCVVTGASAGIGKETAKALAAMGATTALVCRNKERGDAAMAEISQAFPNANTQLFLADLSSQKQVRRVAEELSGAFPKIDVLVNNAGVIENNRRVTEDGLEMTFATNHLAYFLLTNLLLPNLKAAAPSRIVSVSSAAHYGATLHFDDLQNEKEYNGWRAYGQSKLANILFTFELARRLDGTGVTATCLHPGVIGTQLFRNLGLLNAVAGLFLVSPEKGAATTIYLASSPDVEGVTGKFFDDKKIKAPSSAAQNIVDAKRLWEISTALCGLP